MGHRRGLGAHRGLRDLPAPHRGHDAERVHARLRQQHGVAAGRDHGAVHGILGAAGAGGEPGGGSRRARRLSGLAGRGERGAAAHARPDPADDHGRGQRGADVHLGAPAVRAHAGRLFLHDPLLRGALLRGLDQSDRDDRAEHAGDGGCRHRAQACDRRGRRDRVAVRHSLGRERGRLREPGFRLGRGTDGVGPLLRNGRDPVRRQALPRGAIESRGLGHPRRPVVGLRDQRAVRP